MSESALLKAVRDQIRTHDAFRDRQVNVELDEDVAPSVVGDLYVAVIPAGQTPGPHNDVARFASDIIYSVDVCVIMRAPKVPRDRQRDILIATTASLEVYEVAIRSKVDFQEAVNVAADAYILAETGSTDVFVEMLKYHGCGRIRRAPAELFAGTPGEPVAAIKRTYHFRGARRLLNRG